MKILLLSDSHGNKRGMMDIVNKYGKNAEYIVHCGDATRAEAEDLIDYNPDKTVVCVRGNCDWDSSFKDVEFLEVLSTRIMITHGHHFGVKYELNTLSARAKEENCSMAFFGHTHNPTDVTVDGVRLVNPGSCGRYYPSCATVEIDEKGNVLVNLIDV